MKNKLNFLTHLKKMFIYGERLQPTRDWLILLACTGVLLVLGVGWNIFIFYQLENGKTIGTATSPVVQQGTGDAVTQVQTLFQQRATEETNYQQNYHFVDPSLPGS
jgi:hypothetical protein